MKIGIVIPIFSGVPHKLIESIKYQSKHDILWFLYLNKNDNKMISELNIIGSDINFYTRKYSINMGVSKIWNEGITTAIFSGCDIIMVLNDDIIFKDSAFDAFVDVIDSKKEDYGLIFCHGDEPDNTTRCQDFAAFAITKMAILNVGFFDENFFPAYFEDTDYDVRLELSGIKTFCDETSHITHSRSMSIKGSALFKDDMDAFFRLNSIYAHKKWNSFSEERFSTPFNNDNFNYRIAYCDRASPYGTGFDRDDLILLNKTLRDYSVRAYISGDNNIHSTGFIKTNNGLYCGGGVSGLIYGPYCTLEPGRYELVVRGNLTKNKNSYIAITKDLGDVIMEFKLPNTMSSVCSYLFCLDSLTSNFEVVIHSFEDDDIYIFGYLLKRLSF
ncbi:MAG: hypothetical protein ACP5FQ_07430 [Thermoplasmata archaeon]